MLVIRLTEFYKKSRSFLLPPISILVLAVVGTFALLGLVGATAEVDARSKNAAELEGVGCLHRENNYDTFL